MMEGQKVSGSKIRQVRLKAGLTQEHLAREINVTTRNVVRWETGRTTPRLEHLLRIAAVCGVHVAELLEAGPDKDEPMTREQRLVNVGLAIEALLAPEHV